MKRSKFNEAQIAFILQQAETGTPIGDVYRKAGIAEATFYNWRKKYAGLMPSAMKRLKQLEEENGKLKQLVADLSLDNAMLQETRHRNGGWKPSCARTALLRCAATRSGRWISAFVRTSFVHDQLATGRKLRVLTVVDLFSRFSPAVDPAFSYRAAMLYRRLSGSAGTSAIRR